MPSEISAPVTLVYGFLLVVARVGGTFVFVPMPGLRNAAAPVKVALVLALTIALFPLWPVITVEPSMVLYLGWIITEAAFGLAIGMLVSVLTESLMLFGQIIGLQAGYSYASTVDPNTQADSTVLSTMAESVGSLLFVGLGLHRQVIRIFAASLQLQPPGRVAMGPRWSEPVFHMIGNLFSTGLRLALPIVALLMMVDLTLAMLGRINSQLQLLSLSFPLKMLAALAILTVLLTQLPSLYEQMARPIVEMAMKFARQ